MEAYRRYGPALIRKCRRMLRHRQDSEDIVQALFVDLWSRGETELELPYLYRAVTNRCLNHLRDGENRARLLREQDAALRGPARVSCGEQVIELDLLLKLSQRIDEECAEVLVYRYFDDMTLEEIAELTGASRKTVGKRLARVHQAVRALLEKNGGAAPPGRGEA
jgi:RNA polymerase sigma-70 factor (ECF subfamily)